jgi:hypothetical protein
MNIVVSHLLIPGRAILHVAPRIATEDRWLDLVRALQCPASVLLKTAQNFRMVQCPTAVT